MSNIAGFVYIDFVEFDGFAGLGGEFLEDGGDDTAGTTPSSPEVNEGVDVLTADLNEGWSEEVLSAKRQGDEQVL